MNYYIIAPTKEYCLAHGGMHKYIDKIRTASGKWRYIYSRAEAKTRRGVSNIANALNRAKNKGAQILREDKEFYNDLGKKAVNTLNKAKNKGAQILREDKEFYNDLGKKASGTINGIGRALRKKKTTNRGAGVENQYTPGYSRERTKKVQNLENLNRRSASKWYGPSGNSLRGEKRTATNQNSGVAGLYNTNKKGTQYSPNESSAVLKANKQYRTASKQSGERAAYKMKNDAHNRAVANAKSQAARDARLSYERSKARSESVKNRQATRDAIDSYMKKKRKRIK